jgi:soluble lytic murein transglycosylase
VASLVAELAAAAGDAELPFRIARDQLGTTRRTLRWLYPAAFGGAAEGLAAASEVDPFLLLALARRESAFRPDARSSAGAVGLVQLLPKTADRLATLLGTGSSPDLAEPATSLAVGAAYLGLLRGRFPDDAALLFAYNGGPAPAAAWARAWRGKPLDEAVEEIPFRESRRYVKTVLASRAVYGWLWRGRALRVDGDRPVVAARDGVAF